jgi:sterol desaturase/sphingolipid hydroxylase (fatty acid hydroxylase superfamily)
VLDVREILALVLIFVPLERLFPRRPDQRVFRKGLLNDICYLFFNGMLIRFGVVLILGAAMAVFNAHHPAGGAGPVAALPLWAQVILAVLVADIGFYIHHRLYHAVPFLWRIHAVHHSIEELDWLAGHRDHVLDQTFSAAAQVVPLYLLGFSSEAMVIWAFVFFLQAHLQHANVALDFGPLNHIIATPRFHHWHHSNDPAMRDINFSGQLQFMDWLFGTRKLPAGYPEHYGTDEPVPELYHQQFIWPLLPRRSAGNAGRTTNSNAGIEA